MNTVKHDSTTSVIETHCYAAEIMWDEEKAEAFRQICQSAFGRDCVCQEGEPCPLLASAFEQISHADGLGKKVMSDFLAMVEGMDKDRRDLVFKYLAHGLGEELVSDVARSMA